MNEIKNILLIGRTGRGKSTLANVLVNKNDNFEEVFKESSESVSETRNVKGESFEFNFEQHDVDSLINEIVSSKRIKSEEISKSLFDKLKLLFSKLKKKLIKAN